MSQFSEDVIEKDLIFKRHIGRVDIDVFDPKPMSYRSIYSRGYKTSLLISVRIDKKTTLFTTNDRIRHSLLVKAASLENLCLNVCIENERFDQTSLFWVGLLLLQEGTIPWYRQPVFA